MQIVRTHEPDAPSTAENRRVLYVPDTLGEALLICLLYDRRDVLFAERATLPYKSLQFPTSDKPHQQNAHSLSNARMGIM